MKVDRGMGSNSPIAQFSRTGKMPVPHRVSFLVGWASCPPVKGLLIMVQDVSSNRRLVVVAIVRQSGGGLNPIRQSGKWYSSVDSDSQACMRPQGCDKLHRAIDRRLAKPSKRIDRTA
jgi:hypothetical protein